MKVLAAGGSWRGAVPRCRRSSIADIYPASFAAPSVSMMPSMRARRRTQYLRNYEDRRVNG